MQSTVLFVIICQKGYVYMKINPINTIAKKALPIATAAAIGLGALTACSSSKTEKQEPSYVQTEMLKLDNSLDSLKMVKGEGDRAFFDYYDKSKTTINEAKLDPYKALDSKTSKALTLGGIILAGLGLITTLGSTVYGILTKKTFNLGCASILAGILTAVSGIIGQDYKSWCNHKEFNQHKEQKLNELELEKSEYLNTSEINFSK